jgi:spermidine synthase
MDSTSDRSVGIPVRGVSSPRDSGESSPVSTSFQCGLVLLSLFLSGTAGLIDEVVWTKMFGLVFGNTSWAVAVVLTAFMTGLAIGSLALSRIARAGSDLLKFYAALQVGIGFCAAATPWLMSAAETVFISASGTHGLHARLVQFILALAVMIVPTTMMGATLPVLVTQFESTGGNRRGTVGWLYGANMSGAAAGAFASAFFLIGNIGVRHTLHVAAGLSILSAGCALLTRTMVSSARQPLDNGTGHCFEAPEDFLQGRRVFLAMAFVTGLLALAYEVIWTRLLTSQCLGSSTYAFASMLTVFMLGTMVGSFIHAVFLARLTARRALVVFAVLMIALAVTGIMGPRIVVLSGRTGLSQSAWSGFNISILVMLCPAVVLGVTFPLLAGLYGRKADGFRLFYALNTFGGIAGAIAGTFILLGMLGVCAGLQVLAVLGVLAGVGTWAWNTSSTGRLRRIGIFATALCAIAATGMALAPPDLFVRRDGGIVKSASEPGLVLAREDADAYVSVWRSYDDPDGMNLNMVVNGRALSNTGFYARRYMKLMSHLPILLHGNCRDSLVICFGTGMTFGSTALYPLTSSECIEISRAVLRAADCFSGFNQDIARQVNLQPARGAVWHGRSRTGAELILRLEDGRTHLLTTARTYDVITLEPPHPRDAGSANLYSSEFYRLCRKQLNPGGLLVQWIPLFQQSQQEIRCELKALLNEFPYVTGWMPSMHNLLLVGSDRTPRLDIDRIRHLMATDGIRQDLANIGIDNIEQLLGTFFATRDALAEYARQAPPLTDDLPVTEYYHRFEKRGDQLASGPANLRFCSIIDAFPKLKGLNTDFGSASSLCRQALAQNEEYADEAHRMFRRALQLIPDGTFQAIHQAPNAARD